MLHKKRLLLLFLTMACAFILLTGCGGGSKVDYEHQRELSWEGDELTIKLGENKSSGCEWDTKPQDDSVIDYSVNRVFHLAVSKGDAVGTLEAGFKGKGAGTAQILCTTPVAWDGSVPGYTYVVTVTVKEDGTIENATGEEREGTPDANADAGQTGENKSAQTLEQYFADNPDMVKDIKDQVNSNNSMKDTLTVDIEAEENVMKYIYTFKETYSKDQIEGLKPNLQASLDSDDLKANLKDKIKTMEEGFGVSGISIYMEYRNGDGKKICDATFE